MGPDSKKSAERAWAGVGAEEDLGRTPSARDAILESLVAIWRLREKEEEGGDDPSWQDHLEAWLVRC